MAIWNSLAVRLPGCSALGFCITRCTARTNTRCIIQEMAPVSIGQPLPELNGLLTVLDVVFDGLEPRGGTSSKLFVLVIGLLGFQQAFAPMAGNEAMPVKEIGDLAALIAALGVSPNDPSDDS